MRERTVVDADWQIKIIQFPGIDGIIMNRISAREFGFVLKQQNRLYELGIQELQFCLKVHLVINVVLQVWSRKKITNSVRFCINVIGARVLIA